MMSKSCLKKPSVIVDGFFTLQRKTRPGIPNVTNVSYTKEAFEEAMCDYVNRDGGLYLSPVSIDDTSIYGEYNTCKINTEVYAKFHSPIRKEYLVGKICKWDDYTMTFEYTPTEVSSRLLKLITNDTKVQLRYTPATKVVSGKPITKMEIVMLDLSVIPFGVLGIDINEIIGNKKG